MENKKNILITGAGKMGTNYARNLIAMREELNISKIICVDIDFKKCHAFNQENLGVYAHHIGKVPGTLANVVRSQNINALIGATQTDSHISVLKEALSVEKGNKPQIRRILQEKPFGLFDDGSHRDMMDVIDTIQSNKIRFGMDSILMFSEVYNCFANFLYNNPDLEHVETFCTYGKDRTEDTRPAHMGVFGTEGTHAIDIARRLGNQYLRLECSDGHITQGFITAQDPDVPYACCADFNKKTGVPVHIQMSLVFDKNYREVMHVFNNAKDERIEVTLNFDQQGSDKIFALNVNSEQILLNKQTPSNVKLKNAIRSVFGDSVKPYDIKQTLGLRSVIEDIRDVCRVVTGSQGRSPELIRPKSTPLQCVR